MIARCGNHCWPFLRLVYAASLAYARGPTRAAADVLEEVLALTGDTATDVPLYLVQGDLALGARDGGPLCLDVVRENRDMARARGARPRRDGVHDVLGEA